MVSVSRSRRGKLVEVDGLEKLWRKLDELPEVMRKGMRKAVHDETEEIADDERRAAPELTGELKRGIQAEHKPERLSGTVAATARHSSFVEHGTSDTPAQPFVEPAITASRRRFPQRVVEEINAEIKGLTKR